MLKKMYTKKNGEIIDLSQLSLKELEQLNLEEEEYFAIEIKKRKKFSKERNDYSRESYEKIFQIADWKRKYNKNKGNGVKDSTIELLKKMIQKKKRKKKREDIVFYEAGVGKGYALQSLIEEGISIKGCDIFLSEEVKEIQKEKEDIYVIEENLYDALDNIQDETIDIFYADNVLEHIVEDEYEETCKKIAKKIKPKGLAILIIPNAYTGPHDISRIRPENDKKATGFHFMEQSFGENIKILKRYNLKLRYFYWRNSKREIKNIYDFLMLNMVKIKVETILGKIKNKKIRSKFFKRLGYDVYILEKQGEK